jgi:hypothetical protein
MTKPSLDPATSQDQAMKALREAGNRALRLVDLWLEHQNAGALVEVSIKGTGAPRRAARRALKTLRARGVVVPDAKASAVLQHRQTAENHKAWLLAPDSAFNLVLVLAHRFASGRFHAALVYLNDDYGVTQVQQGEFSQSALKKAMDGLAPQARYKPTEVGIDWVRARIHQSLARQRQRGLIEPLGLTSIKELLGAPPAAEVPHPFDTEGLEVAPEDAREMNRSSAELHMLPEFRAWLPARDAVNAMLQDVGKQLTPGEQPEESRMQVLLHQAVIAATDRYFTPERRERLVAAMKDSAISILAREGEDAALKVSATMHCIQSAGLITDPPSEVPFLRSFFDKALAYLLAEGKGALQIPIPQAPPDDSSIAESPATGTPPEPEAAEEPRESTTD